MQPRLAFRDAVLLRLVQAVEVPPALQSSRDASAIPMDDTAVMTGARAPIISFNWDNLPDVDTAQLVRLWISESNFIEGSRS